MNEMSIPTTFSIDFIEAPVKINDLISSTRVRIYYKGGNRNGTWITDDFAEKLNQSLPHVPIVATYNQETEDFEDHNDDGRKKAYGFVPSNPQTQWTTGEDGKQYFTAEVYLWTGYWPEAAKIVGKSHSMELSKESITGDWKVVNGDYYFVYQNASFKGLCALGDAVVPCFENSAFFSLDEESRSFFQSLNEMNEKNLGGGNEKMEENLTNVEIVPEVVDTPVEDFGKVVTTVDTVTVATTADDSGYKEEVVMQESRQITTEFPDEEETQEVFEVAAPQTYSAEEYEAKNAEIAALQTRIQEFEIQVADLQAKIDALNVYEQAHFRQEKMSVVDKFRLKLSEEEISEFVDAIDKYSTEELRTKLSVKLTDKILSEVAEPAQPVAQFVAVPGKQNENGIVNILKRNKKN